MFDPCYENLPRKAVKTCWQKIECPGECLECPEFKRLMVKEDKKRAKRLANQKKEEK